MADFLFYLFLFALFALVVLAALWAARSYLAGQSPVAVLFGPRPERRLQVVEHASVDGKRRLVLIRRDEVEHLLMTGGPVDVVIETGIGDRRPAREAGAEVAETARTEQPQASFSRPARAFGRVTPQVAE